MADGVELVQPYLGIPWEIYASINGQKGERADTQYGVDIKTNIANSGDYIISIIGDVPMDFPVHIAADKVNTLDYSLNAGTVKLIAYLDDETAATDGGVVWQLKTSSGEVSATKYGPEALFLLPAGHYQVDLSLGTSKVTAEVEIALGKHLDQRVTMGAGVIEMTGYYSEGGDIISEGATVEQRKFEPSLDGKHEYIATEYNAPAIFKTPAGKYQVVVTKDYATAAFDVEVKAGKVTKATGVLNAGFLAITSSEGATILIETAEKDISGKRKYIGTEYGTLNKAFSAGKYVVKITESNGEVLGEKEFEVKAGQRTEGSIP